MTPREKQPLRVRIYLRLLDLLHAPAYHTVMWPSLAHALKSGRLSAWDQMELDIAWRTQPHYIFRLALWGTMAP